MRFLATPNPSDTPTPADPPTPTAALAEITSDSIPEVLIELSNKSVLEITLLFCSMAATAWLKIRFSEIAPPPLTATPYPFPAPAANVAAKAVASILELLVAVITTPPTRD